MSAMGTLGNAQKALAQSETSANQTPPEWTIGEMSSEFGVSLRTLRFYEDRKLLRPRREGHSRLYGQTDRLRMQMIVKGKQLGFTLTEIADLIGSQEASNDIEEKLAPAQIVTQIDHLERQRREIDDAISRLRATHARMARPSGTGDSRPMSAVG